MKFEEILRAVAMLRRTAEMKFGPDCQVEFSMKSRGPDYRYSNLTGERWEIRILNQHCVTVKECGSWGCPTLPEAITRCSEWLDEQPNLPRVLSQAEVDAELGLVRNGEKWEVRV